ncbi:hypothetical protein OG423_14300 [Micromonospora zamorensis]|uniref:hypothetical protein n=1 Tax=Micromonospora zamorensis TaxID=709883 RepID=UPI003529E87E|nr:hypothetical protein OG423_14300 [Micromonospora zamorensis]
MNDIDAIRKLAEAATDGPWTTGADKKWADVFPPWALVINATHPLIELQSGAQGVADAEFIAAARAHVPNLCDEVEQLRADLAKAAEQNTALTALLAQSRTNAATYATEVGQLVAENARVRQQRDELKPVVEAAKAWVAPSVAEFGRTGDALTAAVNALPKAEATR